VISLREVGGVSSGSVSLALSPPPSSVPFRVAPVPRTSGGRGQTAPLPSLLEGSFGDSPSSATSRGGLSPPLHVSSPALLPWGELLHSVAGSKRPSRRHRGGGHVGEGGHRGGSPASPSSQLHQHHFSGGEEEWGHETRHQPQKIECGPPGHSPFPHGDPTGRPLCHSPWGLGSLNRFEGCLLPRPHPPSGQEVPQIRLAGPTVPVLRPPLWSVPR
jgi:hypothetical protein